MSVVAGIEIFLFMLEAGFFIFIIMALIYLIVKRVGDKKKENFEKRDN